MAIMPCNSLALGATVTTASVTVVIVSTGGLRVLARGFFAVAFDFATFSAAGSFVFDRECFAGVPGVTSIKHLLDKNQSVWK
jgi:hypothetical protein